MMAKVIVIVLDKCGIHRVCTDVPLSAFVCFCRDYCQSIDQVGGEVLEIYIEDVPCLASLKRVGLLY